MTRIGDRINRRTALVQLTTVTMLAAGGAKAQRPDPSLAQIKITDLDALAIALTAAAPARRSTTV
jgi:hypothetical protein